MSTQDRERNRELNNRQLLVAMENTTITKQIVKLLEENINLLNIVKITRFRKKLEESEKFKIPKIKVPLD